MLRQLVDAYLRYVLQRMADGLIVHTRMKGDGGLVFLTGFDAKADAKISVAAVKDGAYDYTTLDGEAKTIDAYKVPKAAAP